MPEGGWFLEAKGISKNYGGVHALLDVDVAIKTASVHALVGENGAGKSTLGKIIAGAIQPSAGAVYVRGRPVSYRSPFDAVKDGITVITQEVTLLPHRSVIENVYLGIPSHHRGVIDTKDMHRRYRELVDRVRLDLPGDASVGTLSVADQKKVEILRALARNAELIVMDEPTAALGQEESERLIEVVRSLGARGTTIVFVSHLLEQVLEVADTVTVLRDGRVVRTSSPREETPASLITVMLGRSLGMAFPAKEFPAPTAPVVLAVRGIERANFIHDISFDVRAGEIVGLAGLIGSGRSEVARAVFGADRRDRGVVELDGKPLRIRTPRDSIRAGIVMVPEDRKMQGLALNRPLFENITLPHLGDVSRAGILAPLLERRSVGDAIRRLDVRPPVASTPLRALSGGNQQKALFARWLFKRPRVVIADEPTRGVDVGAKLAIYQLLASLAKDGMAVLLISSELEEIIGLAHRILVMRSGRIVAELDGRTTTEEAVLKAAAVGQAAA